MAEDSLSILGYGPAGHGKSTLARTGPTPTLIMDAETASRFIPKNEKIVWDPMVSGPPEYDGTWKYCIVKIKRWETANKTMEWLRSNRHPFKTVVVDSVSEILVKAKEEVNGRDQFQIQHWGVLAQNLGAFLRDLRDITADDESSIEMLYIIATSKEYLEGETEKTKIKVARPFLEGSTKDTIPYLYDMVAYIDIAEVLADPSNPGSKVTVQRFQTGASETITAKSRPPGVPPMLYNITLEGLRRNIFGIEDEVAQPEPEAQTESAPEPDVPVDNPEEVVDNSKSKSKSKGLPGLPAIQ